MGWDRCDYGLRANDIRRGWLPSSQIAMVERVKRRWVYFPFLVACAEDLTPSSQITYMMSTLMAVVTIDRWGRRVGLYWGAIGQGISLILAGAFSRLLKDNPDKSSQYGGAAALFVFLYTAIFGATWLTIPWVYPTETFPLEVRAKGNAFGVVGWSIGNG